MSCFAFPSLQGFGGRKWLCIIKNAKKLGLKAFHIGCNGSGPEGALKLFVEQIGLIPYMQYSVRNGMYALTFQPFVVFFGNMLLQEITD